MQLTLAQSNTPCANQINQTENRKQNQFNLNNAPPYMHSFKLSHIAKQQCTKQPAHTMRAMHAVCALNVFAMRLNTR